MYGNVFLFCFSLHAFLNVSLISFLFAAPLNPRPKKKSENLWHPGVQIFSISQRKCAVIA